MHLHYNSGLHISTNGFAFGNLLPGDGIVPVDSAPGRHEDPAMALSFAESRKWIGHGMTHFDLLNKPAVYEHINRWLGV